MLRPCLLLLTYLPSTQKNITPRYEFGFGLSYTKFKYSDIDVKKIDGSHDQNADLEANWAKSKPGLTESAPRPRSGSTAPRTTFRSPSRTSATSMAARCALHRPLLSLARSLISIFLESDSPAVRQPPGLGGGASLRPARLHPRRAQPGREEACLPHAFAIRSVHLGRRGAVVASPPGHDKTHDRREQSGRKVVRDDQRMMMREHDDISTIPSI